MTFVMLGLVAVLSVGMFFTLDLTVFALGRTGWRRFVTVFLLFYMQIIGSEFLLGLLHGLYSYALALCNVTISGVIVLVLCKRYSKRLLTDYISNLLSLQKRYRDKLTQNRWLLALALLVALFTLWLLFLGLIFPPLDWDGNSYHLTYVADLVQNHSIYDVPANLPWLPGYPKGGELIQAWTVLLTHNDIVADLSQMPFIFLGIASLYGICRNFELPKKNSLFCSLLFLFTPMVISQLTTAYVDVPLVATFFAALALVTQQQYRKLDFLLIGITFSLLISIKSSGADFIAVLLTWLAVQLARTHGKHYRHYLVPAILIILPMSFGLYWYIKDWILYGSPIYPFGLTVHGHAIFHGTDYAKWSATLTRDMPSSHLLRWLYAWTERTPDPATFQYNFDSRFTGLGTLWFVVMLPAAITSFVVAAIKRNYRLLGFFGLMGALLLVYPLSFSPRYGVFIIGLGVVSTAYMLQFTSRYTATTTRLLLIALACLTICVDAIPQHTWGDVSFELRSIVHRTSVHNYGSPYSRAVGEVYEYTHNLMKPGQTIIYTDGVFSYPLWNGDFSNKVLYLKGTNKTNWYHSVLDSKANYLLISTDIANDSDGVWDFGMNQHEDAWAMSLFHHVIYQKYNYEIIKLR